MAFPLCMNLNFGDKASLLDVFSQLYEEALAIMNAKLIKILLKYYIFVIIRDFLFVL